MLLDPLLDLTGLKFEPFDEVYGKPISEKDGPSLRATPAEKNDQESRSIHVSNKARMTVTCCECNKLRVVFSQYRLEEEVCKLFVKWPIFFFTLVEGLCIMNFHQVGQMIGNRKHLL